MSVGTWNLLFQLFPLADFPLILQLPGSCITFLARKIGVFLRVIATNDITKFSSTFLHKDLLRGLPSG